MILNNESLGSDYCPLLYEFHDNLVGIDFKTEGVGLTDIEVAALKSKLKRLRDQAPSNASISLKLTNNGNGSHRGIMEMHAYSFQHKRELHSHDVQSLLRDLFEDSYCRIRIWRKRRVV